MTEPLADKVDPEDVTTNLELANRPAHALWAVVALVAGLVVLGIGAFGGWYVRPAADDWCIAWHTRDSGITGMIHWFYYEVNGRAANALISGVVYSHGLRGPRILPALLAVTLGVGTFLLLRAALRRAGWTLPAVVIAAAAVGLTAITFFAGDAVYQVFFWAPGSVSHTIPVIFGVWTLLATLGAAGSRRRWVRPAVIVLCAVVGFTIGTLSEPFVAVSGVYAAAMVVVGIRRVRRNNEWFSLLWASSWLAGLLAGFAVLYSAPGLDTRSSREIVQPSTLSWAGFTDALHGWSSTWRVIGGQPAYYGVIALGLVIGLAARPSAAGASEDERGEVSRRQRILILLTPLLLVLISSFAVIVGLRIGYGTHGWLYERTWTNFVFPALLTVTYYAALAGRWIATRTPADKRSLAVVVVSVALGTAALVALMPRTWHLTSETRTRATQWDAENARLLRKVKHGATVVTFTPHRIGGLSEPFTYRVYSKDWVSACVSDYYRVERLTPDPAWLKSEASDAYRGVK